MSVVCGLKTVTNPVGYRREAGNCEASRTTRRKATYARRGARGGKAYISMQRKALRNIGRTATFPRGAKSARESIRGLPWKQRGSESRSEGSLVHESGGAEKKPGAMHCGTLADKSLRCNSTLGFHVQRCGVYKRLDDPGVPCPVAEEAALARGVLEVVNHSTIGSGGERRMRTSQSAHLDQPRKASGR